MSTRSWQDDSLSKTLVQEPADAWNAVWLSTNTIWNKSDDLGDSIPHQTYLSQRRSRRRERLVVDPYSGKSPNSADNDPASWQSFYQDLEPHDVDNFGRATNNDVTVRHEISTGATYVLFRLFVLQASSEPGKYSWSPLLQSIVPGTDITLSAGSWTAGINHHTGPDAARSHGDPLKLVITKTKKKKGTPTQSTAIFMLQATDLNNSLGQVGLAYSSMFGIMRRSYMAKVRQQDGSTSSQLDGWWNPDLWSGSEVSSTLNFEALIPLESGGTVVEERRPSGYLDAAILLPVTSDSSPFSSLASSSDQIPPSKRARHHEDLFASQIARDLGNSHRQLGFKDAPSQMNALLPYYASAREKMMLASRFTGNWTKILHLLVCRAAARMELDLQQVQKGLGKSLYAPTDLSSGSIWPTSTMTGLYGDQSIERNVELQDNIAILASWVRTQGILSRLHSVEYQSIVNEVYASTLFPYFDSLAHSAPSHEQVVRFWTFLDLSYLQHWFDSLRINDTGALYSTTLILQQLEPILCELTASRQSVPSLNTTLSPEATFWLEALPT
ncbi:hypothetical protein BD324DRAFT_680711 [Kockovaella imperatae]|uniref:Uncharacterized protein n=1 Tax=Kockovaella imperatae TaxID=4999 RepID=A0A1Y1UK08_9TREE|nr:hypothetical protein BD324DRAFT_680711 [Kockovaella imperatae]ORX37834.1 hypothetical protein BD324DRAFT_680711 [Kockovaella imperatae]